MFETLATVSQDSNRKRYVLDGHLRNLENHFISKLGFFSELDVRLK